MKIPVGAIAALMISGAAIASDASSLDEAVLANLSRAPTVREERGALPTPTATATVRQPRSMARDIALMTIVLGGLVVLQLRRAQDLLQRPFSGA